MMTVRQQIIDALTGSTMTARELAQLLRVPERDIEAHLVHIAKTVGDGRPRRDGLPARAFHLKPAVCGDCGFVFRERTRLTTPSRCPRCRSEHVVPPGYEIRVLRSESA
jgi:predicted Zn-ribbon and HTH transcriptional regulator